MFKNLKNYFLINLRLNDTIPITLKINKILVTGSGENKFNNLNPLKYFSSKSGRLNGLNVARITFNRTTLIITTYEINNTFFMFLIFNWLNILYNKNY